MRNDDGSTLVIGALAVATGLTLIEARRHPPRGSRAGELTEAKKQAILAPVFKKAAWVAYSEPDWRGRSTRYAQAFPTAALASTWIPHYEKQGYKRVSHLEKPTRKHSYAERISSWLTPAGNLGAEMSVRVVLGGRQVLRVGQYGVRHMIPLEALPRGVARRIRTVQLTEELGSEEHELAVLNALAESALNAPTEQEARYQYAELAWYYRDYSANWARGR
jgi:hypothetical protein